MDQIALQESRTRRWFESWAAPEVAELAPIRAELMSVERLEQLAEVLARNHRAAAHGVPVGRSLLARTRRNARVLRDHFDAVSRTSSSQRSVTPAAEWFVDNYYVVERQIQLIRDDLPFGYYRQLPALGAGEHAGRPRIAAVAWSFVAHTDSHFDAQLLLRFISAYQKVEPLTIGELWALASVLRVVLIENLRRCADRIVRARTERERADELADRLLGSPSREAQSVELVLGSYRRVRLPRTLAVQLVQRLRDCDPSVTPAFEFLEGLLRVEGVTADEIVRDELQRQSAANVTVRNIVTSLVQLTALDWTDIVEQLSVVDAILGAGSDFASLDFTTRNRYRSAIEELARDSPRTETDVAEQVVAAAAAGAHVDQAATDPGFYLIGPGRRALEQRLGYRAPLSKATGRLLRAAGVGGYATLVLLLTVAALTLVGFTMRALPEAALLTLLIVLALPVSDVALALINSTITRLLKPRPLPALNLGGVIPEQFRTLVAVPILLNARREIEEALSNLESEYLAAARGELYFALLADGADCASERTEQDEELIALGRRGIAALNARYGRGSAGDRFLWLCRRRRWNPAQQCWMGWERKRGKLHELNCLLRGARDTSFELGAPELAALPQQVRNVLVLDADTQLPHGTAEKLIAKLSHPLNQPRVDTGRRRVTGGYAILQPRVTPALPTRETSSLVQAIFSGTPGLDPYAFPVSDLYQDLFGEGSFTGKGLYDIDAFEAALRGRIGENEVLSHDLLEGIFARAAVVSEVEVIEPAPDRYDVIVSREHRWARGDWQLLPWLRPRLAWPRAERRWRAAPALGRWKIFDNLRRTLVPLAALAAFVVAWLLPPGHAAAATALLAGLLGVAPLLPVLMAVRDRPRHLRRESERQALRFDLRMACLRWALSITFLPDRSWWMADAIARTLYRLGVSHSRLLDWTTAAQARRSSRLSLSSYVQGMRGGLAICIAITALVVVARPENLGLAAPFLLLWLCAPVIARFISIPEAEAAQPTLAADEERALRLIARRTWAYFEQFVTPADHHLPPDNFQETPVPVLAQRTSPTNIGMYLLASAAAWEFGWLGVADWVGRLENSLQTLCDLERFRGHFFNWYDTRTGQPLLPRYVSTVDSGNLAGHLVTLANAVEGLGGRALWQPARLVGICDALELAAPSAPVRALQEALRAPAADASDVLTKLRRASERLAMLAAGPPPQEGPDWEALAARSLRSHLQDADLLHPHGLTSREAPVTLHALAAEGVQAASELLGRIAALAARARRLAYEMDFAFLLKPHRMLLSIGYNVTESRLDSGDYDLLASEARLASFMAIAKRDVPARHWFRLDRHSVAIGNSTALLSWSGSMFEYLMPALIMRAPSGSLLERAERVAVRAQRAYAAARVIPWGISESAYNTRDLDQTYQYSPFGIPALGLKRGLANDTVVSPYATGLATKVDPAAAAANFRRLAQEGGLGHFGFYEALDYTPERLAEGERVAVVRAYMAHHQGMTLVGIANGLHNGLMQSHFHAEAAVRATELLLQERPPRSVESPPEGSEAEAREGRLPVLAGRRRLHTWRPRTPHTQLLSNGRYAVMIATNGAGFSRRGELAVTRWAQDPTSDSDGQMIYLRDCTNQAVWSAGFQPTAAEPDSYRVTFTEDRAEIIRRDGPWVTRMQVLVSAENDAEARRVAISNLGDRVREIEVTSYSEVVLTSAAADRAHRAFSNLFVQTSFNSDLAALVAGRRPRAHGDSEAWAAHLGILEGEEVGDWQFETDRAAFIGRDRTVRSPQALTERAPLSGSSGIVLDPVFSLRRRMRIAPGETARITFWTVVGDSQREVLQVADKCREPAAFDRASTLAWTRARVQLHYLALDPDEASLFQRVATHLFYLNPALRAGPDTLRRNAAGPEALWAHGISGDRPIMLAEIDDAAHLGLVRQLLRAHEYLTLKNIPVDLVIVNESPASYGQDLQGALESLARASQQRALQAGRQSHGGVFTLRDSAMAAESRLALQAAARVALISRRGTLGEQLDRLENPAAETAWPELRRPPPARSVAPPAQVPLELFNGTGGFSSDGAEYTIILRPGLSTPMPWINVIAQPDFGFQVSATGAGFTWALNSRENALTRWSNDAVTDPPAEAIYVRDDASGELYCATAAPARDPEEPYIVHHGRGYSRFEHARRGLQLELLQLVPRGRKVKLSRLTIRNIGAKPRRLTICAYAEWTLGSARAVSAQFVRTERCGETGALLARNPWNSQCAQRTAYLDLAGEQTQGTCDRREFLGLDGTLDAPAALRAGVPLSGQCGAGLDPCAALLMEIELPPGAERRVVCLLGQAEDRASVVTEIQAARNLDVEQALGEVRGAWESLLGTVKVATPDRAFDLLLNRWLPYQVLSCRVWARAAFYQASGAYGFRDQLQDCMALAALAPAITRAHLLRAAGRQFEEGDVQHWWMPESGRGVRTRISDDRVWLAYCTHHYVTTTGDDAVLDEMIPYLRGPPIPPGADDNYSAPQEGSMGSLYEHCALALDASLKVGTHGLPLFGSGDWNDGMNAVGAQGRGESVWLGWFLCDALGSFAVLAAKRGDASRAVRWRVHRRALLTALENSGWDGDWYRRGYFDDGAPLGSALNKECRIDSIAQAWAVLSEGANPARAAHAMAAVAEHLVRPEAEQLLLFAPPFTSSEPNPGYIQAYPPGIRENGGQYTHGAIWSLMAWARLGEGDRAKALFDFFSPLQHSRDAAHVLKYKLEPYAVAADIYAAPGAVGRGGWSWYTGAAGWLYRAGLEAILGICRQGNELLIRPCIPRSWRRFDVDYRYGRALYHITVTNPFGVTCGISHAELDHVTILRPPLRIKLLEEPGEHTIRVVMG